MFAKVFTQIFDSSIVEKPEVRFTFTDLLTLCDINGVVDMTHEAIARRTNRPLAVIQETITELEGPDPRSRTKDFGGARIKRLDDHRDWGWIIVNYEKFRSLRDEEARREYRKEWMAEKRKADPSYGRGEQLVNTVNSSEPMQKQKQKQIEKKIELPFSSKEFAAAWGDWESHRREIKKRLTPTATSAQLKKLSAMGEARSIAAIEHSVASGYQGIYEPNQGKQIIPKKSRTITSLPE